MYGTTSHIDSQKGVHVKRMAKKLRVYKDEDGKPTVKCPRCDELIAPEPNPIFDGVDCPECGQIIEEESLENYFQAIEDYEPDFE
jgi:uncharacterized C2H2 Zn-finger protein